MYNSAYSVGAVCGPLLGGVAVEVTSFGNSMASFAGLAVIYSIFFWMIVKTQTKCEFLPLNSQSTRQT